MRLTGLCSLFLLAATAGSSAVERTNLGISGGRANDYAWDDVHQIMYAGAESAINLFVSADSGQSWECAFPMDSLEAGWSNSCRIIRSDGGVTVASVGSGQIMVISEDGAASWRTLMSRASLGNLAQTVGIQPPPQSASNACIRDGDIYLASGCLVLKTSDFGQNWGVLPFPDTTARGTSSNSRKGVADVVPLDSLGLHLLALATDSGSQTTRLWESTDGISFVPDTILDSSKVVNPGDLPRSVTAINQILTSSTDRSIVVLTEATVGQGNSTTSQIWLSQDTGATWTALVGSTNGKVWTTAVNTSPAQSESTSLGVIYLFEDPNFPNGLRLTSGLCYTDDWGAHWSRVSNSNGPAIHGFRCHVPGTSIFMAFNEDAPYRCADTLGGTPPPPPGLPKSSGVEPGPGPILVSPPWQWVYSGFGMTAVQVNQIAQLPSNLDIVYLATNSGIAITRVYTDSTITDPVQKWQGENGVFPMQPFSGIPSVGTIIISPYDSSVILAGGGNGIWKARNGGFVDTNWTQDTYRNPPMVGGLSSTFCDSGGGITSFAWYSPDTVIASISGRNNYGGLLISTDGGDSFAVWNVVPQLSCGRVYVAEDEASGARWIFAGYGDRESRSSVPCMVWRSGDGGVTWDSAMVVGGSTNQGTHNMVYGIAAGRGTVDTIFFACEYGVAMSTDTGATINIATFPPQPGPGPQNSSWEMCAVTVDKNDKHKVYFASREKIYLCNWSDPSNLSMSPYYSALSGEQILDLLFDDLTMSSSAGFFGLSGDVSPTAIKHARPSVSTQRIMSVVGARMGGIKVAYTTPASRAVTVSLLDMTGRTVQSITQRGVTAGNHTAVLRSSQVARGVYAVSVRTDKAVLTRKFVLVR